MTLRLVDAIAGELGSEDTQTDYTVIGDGVNQFFRIAKHHAQPNRIIDEVSVKGIDSPIPIYEIGLS